MSDCLVIIDVQKGFLSPATEDVPSNLKTLLSRRHFDHFVATQFINTPDSPYVVSNGLDGSDGKHAFYAGGSFRSRR